MTGAGIRIRELVGEDWPDVRRIYEEGIASGHATFETGSPEWEDWNASRLVECRLAAEEDGVVIGFAALSPVSSRPVYRGVAEVMVYVAADARGRGVGTDLLRALVEASEVAGIWTLSAGIFPENEASIKAHQRVGFRRVGLRERIGRFHDGRWRDYVLLERRSDVVGTD